MNSKLVLLLTRDTELEEETIEAVGANGARLIVAQTVGESLEIICTRSAEIEAVIIDFDNGSQGTTLLSALSLLRKHLPLVAVTLVDSHRAAARAYANGAVACLAKPINALELEIRIRTLANPSGELVAA